MLFQKNVIFFSWNRVLFGCNHGFYMGGCSALVSLIKNGFYIVLYHQYRWQVKTDRLLSQMAHTARVQTNIPYLKHLLDASTKVKESDWEMYFTLFHEIFSTFFWNKISLPERRNKRKSVLEITKMYYFKI